jgi:hypothetical protein
MFGGRIGLPELMILCLFLVFPVLFTLGWAKIFSKAGLSPAFCILMLIPLVNLGFFFWFAFSEWPLERQLRTTSQYPPPVQYRPPGS